jgi:uncharacterized protein (UPF0218 family)
MYLPTVGSLVTKYSILDNASMNTKLTKNKTRRDAAQTSFSENFALNIKVIIIAILFVPVYPWM